MSAGPHHGVLDSICSKNLFSPASLLTKVRHVLHAFGQSGEQVTSSGRMGISLLSEWDVLAFVYRHGASLTTADQIARLIGYESAVVSDALDRLEREKLIERSRPSQGVRLLPNLNFDGCRASALPSATRQPFGKPRRSFAAGKRLKPVRPEAGEENNRLFY
jgi:DNA-binding MarR family transcriptional regulator